MPGEGARHLLRWLLHHRSALWGLVSVLLLLHLPLLLPLLLHPAVACCREAAEPLCRPPRMLPGTRAA